MSVVWSQQAQRYFEEHAIEGWVASALRVRERSGALIFRYQPRKRAAFERKRPLNGNKTFQPEDEPLTLWWPLGVPDRVEYVLACEGESDALAALSALASSNGDAEARRILDREDPYVAAVPGTGMPVDRLADELVAAGAREVIIAFDADEPGNGYAAKAEKALRAVDIRPRRLPLPEGRDLSECLASVADRASWLADALLTAASMAHEPPAPTPQDDGHAVAAADADEGEPRLGQIPAYPTHALPFEFETTMLPNALLGGAALAAAACAVGGKARLVVGANWSERAILWVPLIAPRGAGKTPSQELGFGPLRRFDEQDVIPLRANDLTLEALARTLGDEQPAVALDIDELAQLLRGIGEYKRGGGDRGRLLALWSGAPWRYTRVAGAKKGNAVDLRIAAPTVAICGGLQPALHPLLGTEEDGLRPRWLPHLAPLPDDEAEDLPRDEELRESRWDLAIGKLIQQRERERTWRLSPAARAAFNSHRQLWKRQARSSKETASTAAALIKADVHLARVALVLAELKQPGAGGEISKRTIDDAAAIIDFTLACWRALPEQGSLALSFRDGKLDAAVERLAAWLEEHGGRANRRDLLRSAAAGVRTARALDALLGHYEQIYPGSIEKDVPSDGGRPATVVSAPRRRSL